MVFPNKPYITLEDPDVRRIAAEDPRGFFDTIPYGAIIDEVQRLPDILSYIQGIVDDNDCAGRFILTGSHQPQLHHNISQTLAGRTALLTLLPFSIAELRGYKKDWNIFELSCMGEFPRVHDKGLNPQRYFSGYVQTYIERDVRALINLKDLESFQTFLRLLAGRVGQLINYSSISNDVGVSSTTIKSWVSVLKASFIVFELPPYFENIRKRLTKSSKIYFCDVGLACYLLGIRNAEQLQRDRMRGGLYENFVILEFLKDRLNRGLQPDLHFYRDSHGNEVDLIIRENGRLRPIEIKSAATFTPEFIKGIDNFRKTVGSISENGTLCYNGTKDIEFKGTKVINPLLHTLQQ
jgi:predicted AAA+ superfamily ATPase